MCCDSIDFSCVVANAWVELEVRGRGGQRRWYFSLGMNVQAEDALGFCRIGLEGDQCSLESIPGSRAGRIRDNIDANSGPGGALWREQPWWEVLGCSLWLGVRVVLSLALNDPLL